MNSEGGMRKSWDAWKLGSWEAFTLYHMPYTVRHAPFALRPAP